MAIHRTFPFSSLLSLADLHCGGNYTDPEGLLSSDLSGPFTHNRQCVYIITQPLGEQIQVNFTHVELEGQSGCSQSYVEVTLTTPWPLHDVNQHFYILQCSGCRASSVWIPCVIWLLEIQFCTLSQTYCVRTSRGVLSILCFYKPPTSLCHSDSGQSLRTTVLESMEEFAKNRSIDGETEDW